MLIDYICLDFAYFYHEQFGVQPQGVILALALATTVQALILLSAEFVR